MAFYYSASNRAFYSSDIVSVDAMPADKVAVADEAYKALMTAQNEGKVIRPGAGGAPEAVEQVGTAATGITHELTAATAQKLGHVKIGAGVNVGADGTISVDTSTLFKQDSWSTRVPAWDYAAGDIVNCPTNRVLELLCTVGGKTAAGELDAAQLKHGATVTDGTVTWKVRAKAKTINGQEPDANGSVQIDVGVKTVNSQTPDAAGNVNVDISSKRDHTIQIANADLNTLLDDKTWSCSGTLKNTPIPCTFCIVHAYDTGTPISGNIVQVCYVPQTNNTVRAFWRNCVNGATFGAWMESGAVKTVNSVGPDEAGNVSIPNATTSQFGLVRLAAEEDVLKESPQTAVCTQLIYEINEFRRKSTAYAVGEKVDCAFQYERFLECTKAGTTSADMLDTRNVTHGQVIVDGTVEWTVRTHARSVNWAVAGADGNVSLDVGVKTINGNGPDSSGNISSEQTGCLPLCGGTLTGDLYGTSFIAVANASSNEEGGQIELLAPNGYKYGGAKLDAYRNQIRIFNEARIGLQLDFESTNAYSFNCLIERVAEQNFDFIRFTSGVQICWVASIDKFTTWNFPRSFVAEPAVFLAPTGYGSNPGICFNKLTTTSVYLSNGSGWSTSAMAIGRWK